MENVKGTIELSGKTWVLRYWEWRVENGLRVRKRVRVRLAEATTAEPPPKVIAHAEEHMAKVPGTNHKPRMLMSLVQLVEEVFLPEIAKRKSAATHKGYEEIWRLHLKPAVSNVWISEVECADVQRWLDEIARPGALAKNSLSRIKTTVSTIFKMARRHGVYKGQNPAVDTEVPEAREPEETYAYSPEEIQAMLAVLPEPASMVIAVAANTGLRAGELEALRWQSLRDDQLFVDQSISLGKVGNPKTRKSRAGVPVVQPLQLRLDLYRLRCGNPQTGWMFPTSLSTRLELKNLVDRVIRPTLNRCVHCKFPQGKAHLKSRACPGYERNAELPEWHGWHAFRRGLGTWLMHAGVAPYIVQRILRHSNVSTTMAFYVKVLPKDVRKAMEENPILPGPGGPTLYPTAPEKSSGHRA